MSLPPIPAEPHLWPLPWREGWGPPGGRGGGPPGGRGGPPGAPSRPSSIGLRARTAGSGLSVLFGGSGFSSFLRVEVHSSLSAEKVKPRVGGKRGWVCVCLQGGPSLLLCPGAATGRPPCCRSCSSIPQTKPTGGKVRARGRAAQRSHVGPGAAILGRGHRWALKMSRGASVQNRPWWGQGVQNAAPPGAGRAGPVPPGATGGVGTGERETPGPRDLFCREGAGLKGLTNRAAGDAEP